MRSASSFVGPALEFGSTFMRSGVVPKEAVVHHLVGSGGDVLTRSEPYTTGLVSTELRKSKQAISHLARVHGWGSRSSRGWVFSPTEVERMRTVRPGRTTLDVGFLTTVEVATELGKSPKTINRLARVHGWGRRLGRAWEFTREDVERLRAVRRGRPPMR